MAETDFRDITKTPGSQDDSTLTTSTVKEDAGLDSNALSGDLSGKKGGEIPGTQEDIAENAAANIHDNVQDAAADVENTGAQDAPEKPDWREIRREQLKQVTEQLEAGVREYMSTDTRFRQVLETMAKFHHYSSNNIMLIAMQMPTATHVASYTNWQKKFKRQVKRGQKGISIIAPAAYKKKTEREVTDPHTGKPVLDADGTPKMEEVEITVPRFKVVKTFDITQTVGEPLPELDVPELEGNPENYEVFMEAMKAISPVPIRFDDIEGEAKGYYDNTKKEIVIRNGMSESQIMKTAVHEVSHARLHDRERMAREGESKSQSEREIEAESIAYTVLSYYNLDTSDYSIPYLASWSSGQDTRILRSSMDTIRLTASQIIDEVDAFMAERIKERSRAHFSIHQIGENTSSREFMFEGMKFLKQQGAEIRPEDYREVYQGELVPDQSLDDIYATFNQEQLPAGYHGHSLSVSDIIVLHQNGKDQAFYVDSFGFTEVPEFTAFLDQSRSQETPPQEKLQQEKLTQETAPQNLQDTLPQDTQSKEITSQDAQSREITSQNAQTQEHQPQDTLSRNVEARTDAEQKDVTVTFYVAECMDFPVMGEYRSGLTLEEAKSLYETLPESGMQGGRGIGCLINDGHELAVRYPLLVEGKVQEPAHDSNLPEYALPVLQDAASRAKELFPDPVPELLMAETRSPLTEAADRGSVPQPQQGTENHHGQTDKAIQGSPGRAQDTNPETPQGKKDQRSMPAEPGGRKESVLAALRAHQDKVHNQDRNTADRAKTTQRGKGELSL